MAANVETMMYVGETPWHKLGTYVGDEEITSNEAIIAAGLDWNVNKVPITTITGSSIKDYYAVVRDIDNKALGVVKKNYEVVQNKDKFKFIDNILGTGVAHIHTAGSLREGRITWILAKLNGIARVKNTDDTIEKFLLIAGSHDGSMAVQSMFTPVRVVCQNTLNLAVKDNLSFVKIRHTKNAYNLLKSAEETIKSALDYYEEFEDKVNWLAEQKFNNDQVRKALQSMFNVMDLEETPTRTINTIDEVINLVHTGKGNAQWAGTAWGFLNGVAEYADFHRTKTKRSTADTQLF